MAGSVTTWRGVAALKGPAASQGSKRIGKHRKTGKALLLDASPYTKVWRGFLTAEMAKCAPPAPLDEPVSVLLTIFVPRPVAHYGTGRNAGVLKPGQPDIPMSGLDIDKVARAAFDAGTGVWWVDDRRIAELAAYRYYAEIEGVVVEAWAVSTTLARPTPGVGGAGRGEP
jgi:Holliday junction resolvase RusA-like endonuclease